MQNSHLQDLETGVLAMICCVTPNNSLNLSGCFSSSENKSTCLELGQGSFLSLPAASLILLQEVFPGHKDAHSTDSDLLPQTLPNPKQRAFKFDVALGEPLGWKEGLHPCWVERSQVSVPYKGLLWRQRHSEKGHCAMVPTMVPAHSHSQSLLPRCEAITYYW